MNYAAGNFKTKHTHPHEQCGYVIYSKYRIIVRGEKYILTAGDSYSVPENVPHFVVDVIHCTDKINCNNLFSEYALTA